MTISEIAQELRRIRAACHSRSQLATETDLSRLIAALERNDELDKEWADILSGKTVTNVDMSLTYKLIRN